MSSLETKLISAEQEAAQMTSETDSLRSVLKQTTKSLKKQISDYKKEVEELKRQIDMFAEERNHSENDCGRSNQIMEEVQDENDSRISNQILSRKNNTREQLKRRTDRIRATQRAERENLRTPTPTRDHLSFGLLD